MILVYYLEVFLPPLYYPIPQHLKYLFRDIIF